MLAAHILRKRDCSLSVAQDLPEALAALVQDVYDLVLVDTTLKGLDGPGAATALRSHVTKNPENTKFYATSMDHSPAFRGKKTAEGFDGTLAKPFKRDDFLAVLKEIGRLVEG
jgi:CheY-like chemotaxis protein